MTDGRWPITEAEANPRPIFASAAMDPPIRPYSRRMRLASLAMVLNGVLWILVGLSGLLSGGEIDIILMAFFGAAFDAFVALELWQMRWSRTILIYVVVRTFLAAAGFIVLCLPLYVVALLAIPTRWPPMTFNPRAPHPFTAKAGWNFWGGRFGGIYPRIPPPTDDAGSRLCVCGKPERDEIHQRGAS